MRLSGEPWLWHDDGFQNLAVEKGNMVAFAFGEKILAAENTSVLNCCESKANRDLSKILKIESFHCAHFTESFLSNKALSYSY